MRATCIFELFRQAEGRRDAESPQRKSSVTIETVPDLSTDRQIISELTIAAESQMPQLLAELGDLFGKAVPRISRRQRTSFQTTLQRRLTRLIPKFRTLESLSNEPESTEKAERLKEAFRNLVIEMFGTPRIRKHSDVDRLDWLVPRVAKLTLRSPPLLARNPVYCEANLRIGRSVAGINSCVSRVAIGRMMDTWAESDDFRRYVHSLRSLSVAAKRFRLFPTKRISDRAAIDLKYEYLGAAGLLEQQLRLLVCLARAEQMQSYADSKNWSLDNLLTMAATHTELDEIAKHLERNVRNALAHGSPVIERQARRCVFIDRKTQIVWSWEEYFHNTRALTIDVLAYSTFQVHQQLVDVHRWATIFGKR